jgi:hypothetical protein
LNRGLLCVRYRLVGNIIAKGPALRQHNTVASDPKDRDNTGL